MFHLPNAVIFFLLSHRIMQDILFDYEWFCLVFFEPTELRSFSLLFLARVYIPPHRVLWVEMINFN